MMTISQRNAREYLLTQFRLAEGKPLHSFRLAKSGKLTIEEVAAFFGPRGFAVNLRDETCFVAKAK